MVGDIHILVRTFMILAIKSKWHAGQSLTDSDLKVAYIALSSEGVWEQLAACEVLLAATEDSSAHAAALTGLRSICQLYANYQADVLAELTRIAELIDKDSLKNDGLWNSLALAASQHEACECRINAMGLLARLAAVGNRSAAEHLLRGLDDPDQYVRHNAKTYLEALDENSTL
jgi:hypothetical protein